ncbi:MAG: sensor histidine kinase [Candidatus Dormibacteraeota bacterium]|nr:sensor histidine kinase [Candidatus Dormibacteraeota bacterium]
MSRVFDQRVRRLPPMILDGGVALLLMGSADLLALQQNGTLSAPHALLIALITLPVTVRRRYPVATVFWIGLALVANLVVGNSNTFFENFALGVVLYTAFTEVGDRRWITVIITVLVIGVTLGIVLGWRNAGHVSLSDLPYNWLLFSVPGVLAYGVRTRRAYTRQLEERGELLAREAAVEERNRIARELHDVIAHSVSVMVLQATAGGRVARRAPADAAESFDAIQQTGRRALSDLRTVIGVLRADDGEHAALEPQPGLDQLGVLVDEIRRTGLAVDVSITGGRRPLPPGVELSAYRVVQESLTNVLKHAGAAHAFVVITFGSRVVEVEVRDDGSGSDNTGAQGNGLRGMRERVALLGGEVDASRVGSGFRVVARLPLETGTP